MRPFRLSVVWEADVELEQMVNKANFYTDYMYNVSAMEEMLRPTVKIEDWFWGTIGFIEFDQVRERVYAVTRDGRRLGPYEASDFKIAVDYLRDLFDPLRP